MLELITHPKVAIDHKAGALRLLSRRVDDLADDVADQLRGVHTLASSEELRESAFGTGLALGVADTASLVADAAQWLRGSPAQRLSAARLPARFGSRPGDADPLPQGLLLALASDPHPSVRGEAAALTR